MLTTLTDQERRAINEYLGANWDDFTTTAEMYLDAEELEDLDTKLGTEQ